VLTVDPKPLTGSFTVADKVYDGTTVATVTGRSLSGIVGSDDVQLTGGAATFDTTAQGTGKAVTLSGASLGGAKALNYALTAVNPTTAAITGRTVTVTGLAAAGRVYNGLRSVAVGGAAALSGAVNGDDVTIAGSPGGLLDSAGVGSGKAVTLTGLSLGGGAAGNYTLQTPVLTVEITKAPLTVKAEDKTKVYDGGSYSGGYSVTYDGLVNGETPAVLGGTLSYSGTALAAVSAGSYPVTPVGLTSGSYDVTLAAGQLVIGRRALTITANSDAKVFGATKTYGAGSTAFTSCLLYTSDAADETRAV
jgi:hypothetical protein